MNQRLLFRKEADSDVFHEISHHLCSMDIGVKTLIYLLIPKTVQLSDQVVSSPEADKPMLSMLFLVENEYLSINRQFLQFYLSLSLTFYCISCPLHFCISQNKIFPLFMTPHHLSNWSTNILIHFQKCEKIKINRCKILRLSFLYI